MRNLTRRTGLESVKNVVLSLIQSEKYGTPAVHSTAGVEPGEPGHPDESGGKESSILAAEIDRADDGLLSASAVLRNSRPCAHSHIRNICRTITGPESGDGLDG